MKHYRPKPPKVPVRVGRGPSKSLRLERSGKLLAGDDPEAATLAQGSDLSAGGEQGGTQVPHMEVAVLGVAEGGIADQRGGGGPDGRAVQRLDQVALVARGGLHLENRFVLRGAVDHENVVCDLRRDSIDEDGSSAFVGDHAIPVKGVGDHHRIHARGAYPRIW